MAAMMINFINAQRPLLKFIIIHTIAAISWPPPLISQLFSPRLFEGRTLFIQLGCFCLVIHKSMHITTCLYNLLDNLGMKLLPVHIHQKLVSYMHTLLSLSMIVLNDDNIHCSRNHMVCQKYLPKNQASLYLHCAMVLVGYNKVRTCL